MQQPKEIEFLTLLQKYSHIIYHVSRIYGHGDPHYIQELQQEIASTLWQEFYRHGKLRLRDSHSEPSYILNLSVNTSISYYRRYLKSYNFIPLTDTMNSIVLTNEEQELRDNLNELIITLPLDDQRLIIYYLNQCSNIQIARYEGLTESTVSIRLARIFKKLKENSNKQES